MRNTKNSAFTLVELIVVITILAILGTIAFISLQGYSQDAKNSKVTSDLRNMVSAIETNITKESTSLTNMIGTDSNANELASGTVGSGASITASGTYEVGTLDFAVIGQNGEDFKDPNADNHSYLFGHTTLTDWTFAAYQVAGEVVENGVAKAELNGNYYKKGTGDVQNIIADAGANAIPSTGIMTDTTTGLY